MTAMSEKTPNHFLGPMRCPQTLADVDLFAPGAQEHWFEAYEILHRDAPVHRLPGEGTTPGHDAFILTKYADLSRVVRDPERFPPPRYARAPKDPNTAGRVIVPRVNAMFASIMTLRPNLELWKAHRQQLTDPWVGPRGCLRNADMIQRTATALIDRWIDRGQVEFVSEFAAPLPATVMTLLLGFPLEDLPKLQRWSAAQVKPFVHGRGHRNLLTPDEEAEQADVLREFTDYVQGIVTRKRAQPADDMISWLAQVTYPALDRTLSDLEISGIVYAMHLGGLETTQYAICEQAQLLVEHPHVWDELKAEPAKVRVFIEEAMRLRAPTQGLSTRMTTQDEEFQGVAVPAGSILHMRFGAGNLDPDEYENPRELRLDRKSPAHHLTFSQGPRSCPGAGLSRLEQRIAWMLLLDRVERFEFAPDNTFAHQPGIMLGTLALRLRFRRSASTGRGVAIDPLPSAGE
jgi:cytochrome P450